MVNSPLAYQVAGKGKPLVLLHGFLENRHIWDKWAAQLGQKGVKCLLIDLPGHGESPVLRHTHSMEFMADAVIAVTRGLDQPNFSIVGHSMGGYVALALAQKYPEVPDALILLNSHSLYSSPRPIPRGLSKMRCPLFFQLKTKSR
ncbi:MAG: alpha/beta fold hydrolase [Flavobacteriales bacterium]